jgi:outer membrane receptor protein involved in Fe transport
MTSFKTLLLAGLASSALAVPAANAQDLPPSQNADATGGGATAEEEIVVTGTRISQSGYNAPVPLAVVDETQIRTSGSTTVIDTLLRSPLITRGLDASNGGNNTDSGAAFVNLRGLGTNRSLTLVNGRRRVSGSSTSSAVDLNTIPAAMIGRVEITTGGSSAVYGADAVSGVVNIITRKDFDGLEVNAQGGISEKGDAGNYVFSVLAGTKFSDGRGSINLAASYSKQNELNWRDRSFSHYPLARLATPGNKGPQDGVPDTSTYRNLESVFQLPDANFYLNGRDWVFADGKLISATPETILQTGSMGGGLGVPGEANLGERALRVGNDVLSLRSEFSYALTDSIEFFAEGEFTRTNTPGTVEYYRFDDRALWFAGRGGPRIQRDNYYLPASVASLMAAENATTIGVRKRMVDELGVIKDYHDRKTHSIIIGFNGTVLDGWKWDASYQYGEARDDIETPNLLHGPNFFNAIDSIADPVTNQPICRDAAARAAGCVPYNIFSRGPLSQAQRDYFVGTRIQYTKNTQSILGAHLSGDLFRLPAGAVAFAVGAERREEGLTTRDDGGMLNGDIRWGVGSNATPRSALNEKFKVTEGFAEVLVPVIHNTRFMDMLTLTGAIRVSDYNTIGSTIAWQAGANWKVSDDLRLRVTRSSSVRAPNLFELYAPTSIVLTSNPNPCSLTNIDLTANRRANCIALGNTATGGVATLPQIQVISGGNADAAEETSNSLTIGAVITPRAIPRLRLSVDYYDIKISEALSTFGINDVFRGCLDSAAMQGNLFCNSLVFLPNGDLDKAYTRLLNASEFRSSGIDIAADYRHPVGATGSIGVKFIGTYLLKKEFLGMSGDPTTVSIQDGEYTDPRIRFNLSVSYDRPSYGISITNRFLSKSDIDRQALPEARDIATVPHKIYTDAVVRYDLNKTVSGFVGVNNLFNVTPPATPETFTYGALYDVVGRFFHTGIKIKL